MGTYKRVPNKMGGVDNLESVQLHGEMDSGKRTRVGIARALARHPLDVSETPPVTVKLAGEEGRGLTTAEVCHVYSLASTPGTIARGLLRRCVHAVTPCTMLDAPYKSAIMPSRHVPARCGVPCGPTPYATIGIA